MQIVILHSSEITEMQLRRSSISLYIALQIALGNETKKDQLSAPETTLGYVKRVLTEGVSERFLMSRPCTESYPSFAFWPQNHRSLLAKASDFPPSF